MAVLHHPRPRLSPFVSMANLCNCTPLPTCPAELERKVDFLRRVQDVRWQDLEHMAGAVKDFTHSMGDAERDY